MLKLRQVPLDGVADLHLPVGQMAPAAAGEDRVRHRDAVRTEPGTKRTSLAQR